MCWEETCSPDTMENSPPLTQIFFSAYLAPWQKADTRAVSETTGKGKGSRRAQLALHWLSQTLLNAHN